MRLQKLFLLVVACLTVGWVQARDFYWRAHPANNILTNLNNWVTDPLEINANSGDNITSTPTSLMTAEDNLHFTVASDYTALTASSALNINNLEVTAEGAQFVLNYNLTIYGSVSSNGNFSFSPSTSRTVTFAGSNDATIDWGPNQALGCVNMTIDKPNANVQLLNNDLYLLGSGTIKGNFTITSCASFKSNGKDITGGTMLFFDDGTATEYYKTIDLSTSTLTCTYFTLKNQYQPECKIICEISGATTTIADYSTFKSVTLNYNSGANARSFYGTYSTIEDLTINYTTSNVSKTITVSNATIQNLIATNISADISSNNSIKITAANATIDNLDVSSVGASIAISGNTSTKIISLTSTGAQVSMSSGMVNTESITVDAPRLSISGVTSTPLLHLKRGMNIALTSTLSLENLILEDAGGCANYSLHAATGTTTTTGNLTNTGSQTISMNSVLMRSITFTGLFTAEEKYDVEFNSGDITWTESEIQQFYWVGGTGEWTDGSHWSNSSGGEPVYCVPTTYDDVFFDDNSFSTPDETVTAYQMFACRNLTWKMSDGNSNGSLTGEGFGVISGNLDVSGAQTIACAIHLTGKATEEHTPYALIGGNAIFSANLYIRASSAESYQLEDVLYSTGEIHHTSGGFNSNGHDITCLLFYSNTQFPAGASRRLVIDSEVTIAFSTNTSVAAMSLSHTGLTAYDFSGSHFIFTASVYSVISMLSTSGGAFDFNDVTFNKRGRLSANVAASNTFNTLTFENNGSLNRGCTVENLVLTPSCTYTIESSGYASTITIRNSLTATSGCDIITIKGLSGKVLTFKNETDAALSIPGAIMQYVSYKDDARPETLMIVSGGTDLGNNTHIDFIEKVGQTFYWIGGAGNWSEPANWSFSSGGDADTGDCVPGVNDTAIFDENSFDEANQIVTIDMPDPRLHSLILDEAAASWTPTLNVQNDITFTGSLDVALAAKVDMNNTQKLNFRYKRLGRCRV